MYLEWQVLTRLKDFGVAQLLIFTVYGEVIKFKGLKLFYLLMHMLR